MPNKKFKTVNSKIHQRILELAELFPESETHEVLRLEILTTISNFFLSHNDLGEHKLINTALKELCHAFQVFNSYPDIRKVVIFGSGRSKTTDPCCKLAYELSKLIANKGMMVITGAGGGVMQAANQGAGSKNSFGINIKLPCEQKPNKFIDHDHKLMEFKYFFTRN